MNIADMISQWDVWDYQIMGVDVYHIVSWLMIFSVFGWIWETCYVSIRTRHFVNRGFVSGPVCTIYGCGAVSVYMLLLPFQGNYAAIFFVGMVVATILEYVTAALMEMLFHAKWWDYSKNKFNVKGRICLGVSVGWGFMSLALFLLLMPAADWIMSLYSKTAGQVLLCLSWTLYLFDFTSAAVAAFHLEAKLQHLQESLDSLGEKLRESRTYEEFAEKMKIAKSHGEMNLMMKDSRFYERLEQAVRKLEEQKEEGAFFQIRHHLDEVRKELQKGLDFEKLRKEFIKAADYDFISKRFMKSYPTLMKDIAEKKEKLEQLRNEHKEEN